MLRALGEEQGQDLSPEGLGLIWGELKGWWTFQVTWEGVPLLRAVGHEGLDCGHPGKCVRGGTVPRVSARGSSGTASPVWLLVQQRPAGTAWVSQLSQTPRIRQERGTSGNPGLRNSKGTQNDQQLHHWF